MRLPGVFICSALREKRPLSARQAGCGEVPPMRRRALRLQLQRPPLVGAEPHSLARRVRQHGRLRGHVDRRRRDDDCVWTNLRRRRCVRRGRAERGRPMRRLRDMRARLRCCGSLGRRRPGLSGERRRRALRGKREAAHGRQRQRADGLVQDRAGASPSAMAVWCSHGGPDAIDGETRRSWRRCTNSYRLAPLDPTLASAARAVVAHCNSSVRKAK